VAAPAPLAPRCGDGQIDDNERCDLGIPVGTPGSCPITCTTPDPCLQATLVGTACDRQCTLTPVGCSSGDKCCPAQCSTLNDSDCSAKCGDGIVQTSTGETCEIAETTSASMRCPSAADCHDTDACTADTLTGSAENCNAACTHTPITTPWNNDGCCPPGANANSDSDCTARCGNGVKEATEACDGTAGCDANCKLSVTPEQLACMGDAKLASCTGCECTSCMDVALACTHSGNAVRDAACSAVEACATAHNCVGQACYCGTLAPDLTCAWYANGPCKAVIEMAAGSPLATTIDAQYRDPNSALGRAAALGACRTGPCSSLCHL
jgi:hypothetical protein